jgi:hypothetical protein
MGPGGKGAKEQWCWRAETRPFNLEGMAKLASVFQVKRLCFFFSSGLLILGVAPVHAEQASEPVLGRTEENEVMFAVAAYRAHAGYNPGFWLGTRGRGLGYGRKLAPWVQASLRLGSEVYGSTDSRPGTTTFAVTVGPTFNLATDDRGLANAYYVALQGGVDYSRRSRLTIPGTLYSVEAVSSRAFAYNVELGKRFALLPNVSWRVHIALSGHFGQDIFNGKSSTPSVDIVPLALSILF